MNALPTTCPGCGAPYEATCRWCGRSSKDREDVKADNAYGFVMVRPAHEAVVDAIRC